MAGPVAGAPTTDLVEVRHGPSRDRGMDRRAVDRMQTGGLQRTSMGTPESRSSRRRPSALLRSSRFCTEHTK
jgi:hypothetical protein